MSNEMFISKSYHTHFCKHRSLYLSYLLKEIGEYQKAADSLKNDNDQLHKKINDMSNREKEYEAAIAKGKKQQRLLNESLSR